MSKQVAEMTIKALNNVGKVIKGSRVLIMGLTYKENVADTRETPVKEIISELKGYGVEMYGYDPLLDDIEDQFQIKAVSTFVETPKVDGVIDLAEQVFQLPVRVGMPQRIGGMVEVVNNPIYATGSGLLLTGHQYYQQGRVEASVFGEQKGLWAKMKNWFQVNF
jgi:cell division ATPase FtsA